MPSDGIQVAVTGEITPTALTDTYPVTNPYWGKGSLRNVADLTDRDAITVSRRERGMLVYVTSNGHYYSLETAITNADWVDKGTTLGGGSGGASLPIVKYVYVVGDSSDATRMGGAGSGVYTTVQAAYDAAVAIITANSSYIVRVHVGVTALGNPFYLGRALSATCGGITLTADWNASVHLVGESMITSAISFISGDAASGTSFNLDGATIQNLTVIGDVSSRATGATGSGGNIQLFISNVQINGTTSNSLTNSSNSTGSTGYIYVGNSDYFSNGSPSLSTNSYIAVVDNSLPTTSTGTCGGIFLSRCEVGDITMNHNRSGQFIAQDFCTIDTLNITGTAASGIIRITNSKIQGYNNTSSISTSTNVFINNLNSSNSARTLTITNNGSGSTTVNVLNSVIAGAYASNATTKLVSMNSSIGTISTLGASSILMNTSFFSSLSTGTVINGIGTGCEFYNCSIVGGALSINNGSVVTVKFTTGQSSARSAAGSNSAAMGVNITLT